MCPCDPAVLVPISSSLAELYFPSSIIISLFPIEHCYCHESFPPAKSRAPNHAAHFRVHSLPLFPSPRFRQPILTHSDRQSPFAFFASHPTFRPSIGTTLAHPPHPFGR